MHICPDELGAIGAGITFLGVAWRYCWGCACRVCSCVARMVRR